MLSQIGLVFASCIAVSGCTNSSISESKLESINTQTSNNIQQTIANKTIKEQNIFLAQSNSKKDSERKNSLSYNSQRLNSDNYMTLELTGQTNSFGNPLYDLKLFANGITRRE